MNLLCNPQAQWLRKQEAGSVTDGGFTAIQWKALAEHGSLNFCQIKRGLELTLDGAGYAGLMQTLEHAACWPIDGGSASLSFEADGDLTNFHAGIIAYGGVINDPTHPIATWGATPGLTADWTLLGSQSFTLGGTPQTFTVENISIPSDVPNVALIVWGAGGAGDKLRIRNLCLNAGATATPSFPSSYQSWQHADWFYQFKPVSELWNIVCSDRGLASNPTTANVSLALRNPMRKGRGMYGIIGIDVDWEMLPGSNPSLDTWWAYAGGSAAKFAGVPTISCHHTRFINFSIPLQSPLPTSTAVQIRNYRNDSTITVDAQL
jgi:hypothetical protein